MEKEEEPSPPPLYKKRHRTCNRVKTDAFLQFDWLFSMRKKYTYLVLVGSVLSTLGCNVVERLVVGDEIRACLVPGFLGMVGGMVGGMGLPLLGRRLCDKSFKSFTNFHRGVFKEIVGSSSHLCKLLSALKNLGCSVDTFSLVTK